MGEGYGKAPVVGATLYNTSLAVQSTSQHCCVSNHPKWQVVFFFWCETMGPWLAICSSHGIFSPNSLRHFAEAKLFERQATSLSASTVDKARDGVFVGESPLFPNFWLPPRMDHPKARSFPTREASNDRGTLDASGANLGERTSFWPGSTVDFGGATAEQYSFFWPW